MLRSLNTTASRVFLQCVLRLLRLAWSLLFVIITSKIFSPPVTYRGRRDADYAVIIGSRATGAVSCLVFFVVLL